MNMEELKGVIEEKVFEKDGHRKLQCSVAFGLSAEHEIDLQEIGRVCNENGIRICQCQLGCFE